MSLYEQASPEERAMADESINILKNTKIREDPTFKKIRRDAMKDRIQGLMSEDVANYLLRNLAASVRVVTISGWEADGIIDHEANDCYFCGSGFVEALHHREDSRDVGFFVLCPDCNAQCPVAKTESEAYRLWNQVSINEK